MERKSVVMVRWLSRDKWEAYSSLVGFCARHREYSPPRIYSRWDAGVYKDMRIELRRVPFILNPYKTRRGNLKRAKPGPKGPRKKAP